MKRAFIDIETNYLGSCSIGQDLFRDFANHDIIVIGILILRSEKDSDESAFTVPRILRKKFYQLVGPDISLANLLEILNGIDEIITYNGRSKPDEIKGYIGFDFGVINAKLGIVLDDKFKHKDLSVECWKKNLYGGLKNIEKELHIDRILPEKDGLYATEMWKRFQETGEEVYLELLLIYNKEDILNLVRLEEALLRI